MVSPEENDYFQYHLLLIILNDFHGQTKEACLYFPGLYFLIEEV